MCWNVQKIEELPQKICVKKIISIMTLPGSIHEVGLGQDVVFRGDFLA